MAGAGGIEGLHAIDGTCDLCGECCDSETQELNALTCTFAPNCPEEASCYHQDCLERYLKNIRCEKNRKTGFKCPRGCGKGTAYDESCRGKIDKSHPIHVRNDNNKKRKKARMPEAVEVVPRFGPAAKAARAKERELEKAKQKKISASAATKLETPQPRAKAAVAKKESLASAAAAARRELGLASSAPAAKVTKATPISLAARGNEDLSLRSAAKPSVSVLPTIVSVWGVAKVTSKSSPVRPSPLPPLIASDEAFPEVASANKPSAAVAAAVAAAKGHWANGIPTKAVASMISIAGTSVAESASSDGSPVMQSTHPKSAAERPTSPAAVIASAPLLRHEVQKVSKAFKKNMRRAERKKEKEADVSVTSEPSPPLTPHRTAGLAPAQSPDSSPAQRGQSPDTTQLSSSQDAPSLLTDLDLDASSDMERCLKVVAQFKLQQAAKQLQQLGFSAWQSALAVNLCSAILPAATWLLQPTGGRSITNCTDGQKMLDDAVHRKALPEVDITQEMGQLEAAATALDVSLPVVCAEVIRCQGDLRAALAALSSQPHQQQLFLPHPGEAAVCSRQGTTLLRSSFRPPSILGLGLSVAPADALSLPPYPSSACSRRSSTLVDANDVPLAALPARASAPIGPSTSAGDRVPQLSQQGLLQTTVSSGFCSFDSSTVPGGSSAAGSADMFSRVSSFDMLSVGAPWSALDSHKASNHASEPSDHGGSKLQVPAASDRSSFSQSSRPLPLPQALVSPFGSAAVYDAALPPRRPVMGSSQPRHQSSSLFAPSPSSCFGGVNGMGNGLGMDHYASALSSQPSWASTSSNLWGTPLPSSACGFGDGAFSSSNAFDLQRTREMSDVPAAALLAAAAVASESDFGSTAGGTGNILSTGVGNNPSAINDSELSALMATLMCR